MSGGELRPKGRDARRGIKIKCPKKELGERYLIYSWARLKTEYFKNRGEKTWWVDLVPGYKENKSYIDGMNDQFSARRWREKRTN